MSVLRRRGRPARARPAGAGLIDLPPRRVFHDAEQQQQFDRSGYVLVELLDEATVADLLAGFDALGPLPDGEAYHHDLWGHDRARKDDARALLAPPIDAALDRVLVDYRQMTHAFIRKHPGPSTTVLPHVDISFVDENHWRSVMAWVSLTGATTGEGILHIVPGSHRLRAGLRAHMDDASTLPDLVDDIVERWAVPVEVPVGWAVIFDHGIVHYAEPNLGRRTTVTAQSVCIPVEAQLRYSSAVSPGHARVHAVDEEFYLEFSLNEMPTAELLAGYPVVDEVATPTDRLERDQLDELARRGAR